jgi:hypothetical protein
LNTTERLKLVDCAKPLRLYQDKDKSHVNNVLGGYILPGRSAHHSLSLYLWIRLYRVRCPPVAKEAVALVPSDYAWYVCLRSRSLRLLLPRPMASPAGRPVLLRREGHHAGKLRSYFEFAVHSLVPCAVTSHNTEAPVVIVTPVPTLTRYHAALTVPADLHRTGILWTVCPLHRGLQYVARHLLLPHH